MTARPSRSGVVSKLASTGLVGIGLFIVTIVSLHFFQPNFKPQDEAMSYYVHGSQGWLLTVGLLGLGIASLAITGVLADSTVDGPGTRLGRWLLAVWSAGVLLGGVFPTDPPGHWDRPPSFAGMVHGNAALVSFVAFPVAALLLSRSFRRDPRWRSTAGVLSGLAMAAMISLIAFMASLIPVFVRPGPPILLGLSERALIAVYVAWLALASVTIVRGSPATGPT